MTEPAEAADTPTARPRPNALGSILLTYLALLGFLAPLEGSIGLATYADWWNRALDWIVPRAGRALFGVEAVQHPTGSGDTAFQWVLSFCLLAVAVPLGALAARLPAARARAVRLAATGFVRLCLALALISYGAAKVYPSQFPPLAIDRLLQRVGDASPMGVLWTFMSASPAYTVLAGAAEILAGILLCARRTALLGALFAAGILANVFALNLCYDVPVKLYSGQLLLMALLVMVSDAARLLAVFVTGAPAPAARREALFERPLWHRATLALRTGLVAYALVTGLAECAADEAAFAARKADPLFGLWEVQRIEAEGDLRRTRYVVVDYPGVVAFLRDDATRTRYAATRDDVAGTLVLKERFREEVLLSLRVERKGEVVSLEGTASGAPVALDLRRIPVPPMRLHEHPFRLVQEYSANH
ncbi:MAG: hypothetical protein JNK60_02655 [Acidobacteria bacterium]|nr:hypothetical protein [Acidobacteriota bacterium]